MTTSRWLRPLLAAPLLAVMLAWPAFAVELTVDIERVGAQTGRLTVFLFDSEEAWDGKRDALTMQRAYPDGSDRLQVRFDGLKAGRYGVMVLHDKDGNRKFDIGPLGIPRTTTASPTTRWCSRSRASSGLRLNCRPRAGGSRWR
ncbi:MAG TPA: DUF2141 domain-containing protein [Luteimonas sp.]